MEQGAARTTAVAGAGAEIMALAAGAGSAGHPYIDSDRLNNGSEAARNLADAAHYLCMLHGGQPGVVDLAAMMTAHPGARGWLEQAIEGFGRERSFLTHLTAIAGPLPSTAGHAECETTVLAQHRAVETLARSERAGCAIGAAIGLILDWTRIRPVLVAAAAKLDVEASRSALPSPDECSRVADIIGNCPAARRAMLFGTEQMLEQHRGLWDLLEAREAARDNW